MFAQIVIAITGLIAIALTQQEKLELRKYACIFGLAGQPFWFHATYVAEQWGIFGLTFAYTIAWIKGVHTYWIKPPNKKPQKS